MGIIKDWDVCPKNWKKNFKCFINIGGGLWRLEKNTTFGKSIFNIEEINPNIKAPTFADIRNILTGLLEAEWLNDNFVFDYPHLTSALETLVVPH